MREKQPVFLLQHGYTLIEIMIALVVFSIIATITATAMSRAFDTRALVKKQSNQLDNLQLTIAIIERDIFQITNRSTRDVTMALKPFIGRKQYTEFTRGGFVNPHTKEKASSLKRVALFCRNNELIRRVWRVLDAAQKEEYADKVLLSSINNCTFAYLSDKNEILSEWRSHSLTTAYSSSKLPKAIQLNFVLPQWGKMSMLFIISEGLYG